jgi:hypothetical protein
VSLHLVRKPANLLTLPLCLEARFRGKKAREPELPVNYSHFVVGLLRLTVSRRFELSVTPKRWSVEVVGTDLIASLTSCYRMLNVSQERR